MIEIIKQEVKMPPAEERRYQKDLRSNKWVVIDNTTNSIRYKGRFEDVAIACHNLNKKYYSE